MSGGPYRVSPAYEAHVAARAVFKEKNGWRRVDHYASNVDMQFEYLRPKDDPTWSSAAVVEHQAVRDTVGLFDLTSFGKIEVAGHGAGELLEWVCANRVARGTGSLTYTQWLDPAGRVVADDTVGQLDEEHFLVVTGTSAIQHDLAWLRDQAYLRAPDGRRPVVTEVTSAWACFGIWGPRARSVLRPLVDISLDSENFPYMSLRLGVIQGVPVRLCRVTFVGELGWEVYVPTNYGRWLWDLLSTSVADQGGRLCGYRAIDSLRLEKGYLYLGADLTADRTPFEGGVGMFVRMDKKFQGRDALATQAQPDSNLRCIVLDDPSVALRGGEPVEAPGDYRSRVTSGGFGYTLGVAAGFAMLPSGLPDGATVDVQAKEGIVKGRVTSQPLYDPSGSRLRC